MAWDGGTVKALCDVYGRLYVNEQDISGENYFAGIAWDDNGIVSGFNSDDEAFMQIILTYGCNNSVLSYNETSATVTINSESVVFNFTDGQLVPVTSAWQQGSTPMFFYRSLNENNEIVTVVCTPDGKLYVDDNDNYILRVNDGFAWSTGAASQTLITNCGGKVAMDEAAGDDNLMTVISMNDYTVVFNEDGNVTVGEILPIPLEEGLYIMVAGGNCYLVNEERKIVYTTIIDGSSNIQKYFKSNGLNNSLYQQSIPAAQNIIEEFGVLEGVEGYPEDNNLYISYKGKGYTYYNYSNKFDNLVKYA